MSQSLILAFGLLVCSTCSLLPSVSAWGGQGHNATARLAQSLFTPAAAALTQDLLPDKAGHIDSISSWADEVRDLPAYSFSYGMHFVNTPSFACHYLVERDCKYDGVTGVCVDGAVRNYTRRLQDASIADQQQYREALQFLVHFTGDLHQPLHAGFAGDLGGNQVYINWTYGSSPNLHSLWDSGMIARRVALNFSNDYRQWDQHLLNLLQTTYKDNATQWTSCGDSSLLDDYAPCSDRWVEESAELCCSTVYLNETGGRMTPNDRNVTSLYSLGDIYYQRNIDLLEMRIIQAGVRMAFIINNAAANISPLIPASSTGGPAPDEESGGFGTLDIVIAIILVLLIVGAASLGFLYWRKRKYGLSSLFESTDGAGRAGSVGRGGMLLDDDDSSSDYRRT